MTSLLAGRGAVVVGGSRGIGAAVAALLAQHGAGVVVNGRDADAANATAEQITAAGGRAVAHPGSPSDQQIAESLVDRCIDEFGGIHVLINCAGIAEPPGSSILDISSAQFAELLDAHLGTVFATCRAAAPKMVAQGGGSIVNSSSFAFLGHYGGTGYPAGKGAVNIPVSSTVSSSSSRTGAAVRDQLGGSQGALVLVKLTAETGKMPLGGKVVNRALRLPMAVPVARVCANCSES